MKPLNFFAPEFVRPVASPADAFRSSADAINSRNPPIAPGGDPDGFLLVDLEPRECRFPTSRDRGGARFCAMPVEPDAWRPGKVNGCYCDYHRDFLAREPRVSADEVA